MEAPYVAFLLVPFILGGLVFLERHQAEIAEYQKLYGKARIG